MASACEPQQAPGKRVCVLPKLVHCFQAICMCFQPGLFEIFQKRPCECFLQQPAGMITFESTTKEWCSGSWKASGSLQGCNFNTYSLESYSCSTSEFSSFQHAHCRAGLVAFDDTSLKCQVCRKATTSAQLYVYQASQCILCKFASSWGCVGSLQQGCAQRDMGLLLIGKGVCTHQLIGHQLWASG